MAHEREFAAIEIENAKLGPVDEAQFGAVRQALERDDWAEARALAGRLELGDVRNVGGLRFHDFSVDERLVYACARNLALTTPQAIVELSRAVRHIVATDIPGSFIECGVYRGGSVVAMIRTLQAIGREDRDLYLYDTFEGMPEPGERDVFYTGETAKETWEQANGVWARASEWQVTSNLARTRYPTSRLHLVKGLVEDTLPGRAPETIALLRLDTDFYRSTRHELEHLYPRLAPGGILIVDDYGAFRGSQEAVDEYFAALPAAKRPFLARVDENVRLAVKL